jgi:hypothetical protein
MKMEKKDKMIWMLVILVAISFSITGFMYLQQQNLIHEQTIQNRIQEGYIDGWNDGLEYFNSQWINQLSTKGYIQITVDTDNGTQILFLRPELPNGGG